MLTLVVYCSILVAGKEKNNMKDIDSDIAVRISRKSYEIAKEQAKKEDRNIKTIVKLSIEQYAKKKTTRQ